MKRDKFTIGMEDVIDLEKWQPLQDDLAAVTEMAIILVDFAGRPVSKHSARSAFCSHMRTTPELSELCERCDSRGGIEAVRTGKTYCYQCHFGIVDMAIPILKDGAYLGSVMAGQVLLEEDETPYDAIFQPKEQRLLDVALQAWGHERSALPRLTRARVERIASMIEQLTAYLLSETAERKEMESHLTKAQASPRLLNGLKAEQGLQARSQHEGVNRAVAYIEEHKGDKLTLEIVAERCFMSPSHLSRTFKKVHGVTFSAYVNQRKAAWGKELLQTTNYSVSQISDLLGYGRDASYFIKCFKDVYGLTPKLFREQGKGKW